MLGHEHDVAVGRARDAFAHEHGRPHGDGEEVRVVSMGASPGVGPGTASNKAWSVELCGGTHVRRTGDIGLVKIVAESASAAGVRRIEALTADAARDYLAEQEGRLKEVASALHVRPEDVVARVQTLVEERKSLERQLSDAKKQLALGGGAAAGGDAGGGGIKTVVTASYDESARQA